MSQQFSPQQQEQQPYSNYEPNPTNDIINNYNNNNHNGSFKSPYDWTQVLTIQQLRYLKGAALISKLGGLNNVLNKLQSALSGTNSIHTSRSIGSSNRKASSKHKYSKSQLLLYTSIQHLFPNEEIQLNYLHPGLNESTNTNSIIDHTEPKLSGNSNSRSGRNSNRKTRELDIYLPSFGLAFEYQGSQHYTRRPMFGLLEDIQKRDQHKREVTQSITSFLNTQY